MVSQVNICLRRLFFCFNVFFVVGCGLVIVVSLTRLSPSLDHEDRNLRPETADRTVLQLVSVLQRTAGPAALYVAGSVTMAMAVLGVWGVCKENRGALILFLVYMMVGCLQMLRDGVQAAVARPQLQGLMEKRWRSFVPLDETSDDVKRQLEALQTSLQCCGVFSHEDWRDDVPESCLCDLKDQNKCQTVKYKNFFSNLLWQQKSVFTQTCFSFIMDAASTNADITLAVVFTLFSLALLGSLLSSLVVCQMFNTAPGGQPPSYQQLYNLQDEDEQDTFKIHEDYEHENKMK
ncbi:23 kDa integral membrane protein-like [Centropristis striata]|uniref:23 kDa integral membrane protein-like n=1 Tax=Centropristis striata TaxID=184440 RepID=UPI0027DF767B|nr:23 kDa integral membrane protein-like [Centropristis striata]